MTRQALIGTVNLFLQRRGEEQIGGQDVAFVRDSCVRYEHGRAIVHRTDICTGPAIDGLLAQMQEGGPSWIHANLIRNFTGEVVIAVSAGHPIGAPRSVLNVSIETSKDLVIGEIPR